MSGNNPRTEERTANWAAAQRWWVAGRAVPEIAAMVGVSRGSVYMHARSYWPKREPLPGGPKPASAHWRLPAADATHDEMAVARTVRQRGAARGQAYRICTSCYCSTTREPCNICGGRTVKAPMPRGAR